MKSSSHQRGHAEENTFEEREGLIVISTMEKACPSGWVFFIIK